MIKLDSISLTPYEPESLLQKKAAGLLGVSVNEIAEIKILKKSVDARKKQDVKLVYSIAVRLADHPTESDANIGTPDASVSGLTAPHAIIHPPARDIVIAGAGPAGLFCALTLARAGAKVILLERGSDAIRRKQDIESFWRGGPLNPESNVQFGLGGAGTFSDGKLTTGKNDPRLAKIIEDLILMGASEDIAFLSKPHIGTDRLFIVVQNLRDELSRMGVSVRFSSKLAAIRRDGDRLRSVVVESEGQKYTIETDHVVLATGHSARDTYEMLYDSGVSMQPKSFAVGVRIEHLQRDITAAQYGEFSSCRALPVPDYKLVCHLPTGRSVYTFCVCPGGNVIAAASEPGQLVTNGMSNYLRDGININGGLLVGVSPLDYGTEHPLGGMYYQRELEKAAFELGGGNYFAPCQNVGDFLNKQPSTVYNKVHPTYLPGVKMCDISACLPEYISESLRAALPELGRKLKGFDDSDALLTAVETRSSAPVTITRDKSCQANVKGLYPCGEGAGYAGGIMSAAADGLKIAEAILSDN